MSSGVASALQFPNMNLMNAGKHLNRHLMSGCNGFSRLYGPYGTTREHRGQRPQRHILA